MHLYYKRSPAPKTVLVIMFFLANLVISCMARAEESEAPKNLLFGSSEKDGWALELVDTESASSIFLPFGVSAKGHLRSVNEHISAAEHKPIKFYSLKSEVNAFLYNSEKADRLYSVEANEIIVPLTPCPSGWCLPPWFSQSLDSSNEPSVASIEGIPIVASQDLSRYFQIER